MFDLILCLALGLLIGIIVGFPLGFLCTKKAYSEEIFDVGFTSGFDYGKNCFWNPQAKG